VSICFTGDWVPVTLPHTKLEFGISDSRYVLPCAKCDGHGVLPDITIAPSAIVDAEMDYVKQLITKQISPGQ